MSVEGVLSMLRKDRERFVQLRNQYKHFGLELIKTMICKEVNIMKPYVDLNGKAKWSLFWGDKVKKKIKKVFKKSARKKVKLDECQD